MGKMSLIKKVECGTRKHFHIPRDQRDRVQKSKNQSSNCLSIYVPLYPDTDTYVYVLLPIIQANSKQIGVFLPIG